MLLDRQRELKGLALGCAHKPNLAPRVFISLDERSRKWPSRAVHIGSPTTLDMRLDCACPAVKQVVKSNRWWFHYHLFSLFLKPIKIDRATKLSPIACYVRQTFFLGMMMAVVMETYRFHLGRICMQGVVA